MNFQFIQGAVWTCLLLGTWNFILRPNLKPVLFLRILNIVVDTLKSSRNTLTMKPDGNMIKIEANTDVLYLPTFRSGHMLDVVCYQDPDHRIRIPITLVQYKDQYIYVPFKPNSLSLSHVYVGIKYLTKDSYKFFEIQGNDFVDIPTLLTRYETQLQEEPAEALAEAYDDE